MPATTGPALEEEIDMRVLVTWGSKHGGTEGIGRMLGAALAGHGLVVVNCPVEQVQELGSFDAVILGGALYANRWPASVRRFVSRHIEPLRKMPVWFFSSGPLDDSAERGELPPPPQVAVLAERVGARGHVTFGGRLEPDVKGFPASAMAKKSSGDWRNPERIRAWADRLAAELPTATPGTPIEHPARSLPRLLAYGLVGGALCTALLVSLSFASRTAALAVHAVAAPGLFAALAWHYFRARGAREPLPVAGVWTAAAALLELAVLAGAQRGLSLFTSAALWIAFALIFLVPWGIGALLSMMPWPKPSLPAGKPPQAITP
jgi:menaquinone-dependent protoporphyrinogen oxidase